MDRIAVLADLNILGSGSTGVLGVVVETSASDQGSQKQHSTLPSGAGLRDSGGLQH
ncbi:MAG: hypothetical protein ACHREM_26170 [Polyangiales bacterium]